MHGLLVPVLAQLVTLTLADRIEGHYVVSSERPWFESSNTAQPGGTLKLDWRRATLTFGYTPSFVVVPLEERPRELLLVHQAALTGQYRWQRTTLSLNQSATYGERDFRHEALGPRPDGGNRTQAQAPNQPAATPGGTPTPPTAGQGGTGGGTPAGNGTTPDTTQQTTPALEPVTTYGAFRGSATYDQVLSRSLSFAVTGGYTLTGGMGRVAQRTYPLSRGPDGNVSVRYAVDARNVFVTTVASQLIFNESGNNAFVAYVTEDFAHQFSRKTSGIIGGGVTFGRDEPAGGLPRYSIYPNGRATLAHAERLAQGKLTLGVGATTAPQLDLVTARVDPRIGGNLSAGWTRDRFTSAVDAATTLSIGQRTDASLGSILTSAGISYELGLGFFAETGVRGIWERYGEQTTIRPSAVFFGALRWNAAVPLNGPREPR